MNHRSVPPGKDTAEISVGLSDLRRYCTHLLRASGLADDAADLVADSLTDAEARGIRSHGICRVRIYVERLIAGMLDPSATPSLVHDHLGGALLDAHNAIGHVGARAGIDLAIERTTTTASCVVGVRNSNHCGTLAYFLRRATDAGLVALALSNAPPTMAYHGGRTRAVGTNPLAIGIPRLDDFPIIVDMATSATARGKIIVASQLGASIPDGWAVDRDGRPTNDADTALDGAVLPFAGAKGSGLAMAIDLLSGGLLAGITGDQIGDMYEDWTQPQHVSHLFITINPDAFVGRSEFLDQAATFTDRVHDLPTAEGVDRVLLPGEIEERAWVEAEKRGVVLSEPVIDDLGRLAEELGLTAVLPTRAAAG